MIDGHISKINEIANSLLAFNAHYSENELMANLNFRADLKKFTVKITRTNGDDEFVNTGKFDFTETGIASMHNWIRKLKKRWAEL